MTDRDDLIGRAWKLSEDIDRVFDDSEAGLLVNVDDMCAALVDAGWRPPPSGDVLERAIRVVADDERFSIPAARGAGGGYLLPIVLGVLADAGLLARPAQQGKADAIALLWPDMADEGSETPEARADDLTEQGRRLANQRDDLIATGADPAELAVPLAPATPVAAGPPPAHLALDLWVALGCDANKFHGYYDRNGWADTWAALLHAVREARGERPCGVMVDGEPCVLLPHSMTPHTGASDVGTSEPVPWTPVAADDATVERVSRAIADPGALTARGVHHPDDPAVRRPEALSEWQTRAVIQAITGEDR